MSDAPYSVRQLPPGAVPEWEEEAPAWNYLARGVLAEGSTDPLTIKAFYVTGLILHSCLSVNILLAPDNLISTTYYAAYGTFAASIELLGRCIRGNRTNRDTGRDLAAGFKWLARPMHPLSEEVAEDSVLVSTINFPYTISDLVALRHFASHGQAINLSTIRDFDYLVLAELQPLLADSIQDYLTHLASNVHLATSLARSSIAPFRNRPIFDGVWPFPMGHHEFPLAVGAAIRKLDWSYKDPLARYRSR